MEQEQPTFTVTDENGSETTFYILFAFDCAETGKSYLVYTDDSVDADGGIRVSASCFDPSEEQPVLMPIRTEREWDMVAKLLNEYQRTDKAADGSGQTI